MKIKIGDILVRNDDINEQAIVIGISGNNVFLGGKWQTPEMINSYWRLKRANEEAIEIGI